LSNDAQSSCDYYTGNSVNTKQRKLFFERMLLSYDAGSLTWS